MKRLSIMSRALALCLVLALAAPAPGAEADIKKEMEAAYREARALQQEKKFAEAVAVLARYDDATEGPADTRVMLADYKAWLYQQLKDYDTAYAEVLRALDIALPDGYQTGRNVPYGPHERQRLDFFLPTGAAEPTPLLVLIHGGGWLHGNQTQQVVSSRGLIRQVLSHGGAVAAITYRLNTDHQLPVPVLDAARAIQFLRANAEQYGLDKTRVVAMGGSAGGATTTWLATHDDIADPDAEDPVLRESSRLSGAVANAAQTTLDPAQMEAWGIERALAHAMFRRAVGCDSNEQMLANIEDLQPIIDEYSAVKHLSADDPPIYLSYIGPINREDEGVHHPIFGYEFKKAADAAGVECHLSVRHEDDYPPPDRDYILQLLGLVETNE